MYKSMNAVIVREPADSRVDALARHTSAGAQAGFVGVTGHPASIGDGGMRVCPWMSPISIPTSSM